jgi:hypothetical protein
VVQNDEVVAIRNRWEVTINHGSFEQTFCLHAIHPSAQARAAFGFDQFFIARAIFGT